MARSRSRPGSASPGGPSGFRLLRMGWSHALLLHWPLPVKAVRQVLPEALEVDTWDNQAWVSILAYRVRGVRPTVGPSIPWFSNFLQIDVRTYVRHEGEPGVFFFSVEASHPIAVWLARTVFRLPYFRADIQLRRKGESFRLGSARSHQGARAAAFECLWTPREPLTEGHREEFVSFLLERSRLFAVHAGKVLTCAAQIEPGQLRRARVASLETTLFEAAGLPEPSGPPIAHACDSLALELSPMRAISADEMAAWFDAAASTRG